MGTSAKPAPYYAPTAPGARPLRPAATDYQTQEEYDAQDAWAAQGAAVNAGQAYATSQQQGADAAYTAAAAKQAAVTDTNVSGWTPSNTRGATSNTVAQWLQSLDSLKAQPSGAGATASGSISGGPGAVGGGGGGSAALSGYQDKALADFDPTAAGATYAGGAIEKFNANLTSRLDTLQNTAVGAGRLRTGFYDRDQGSVATQLGKDFNADIAQEAGVFSGQRLSALQSDAANRLTAAGEIDANTLAGAAEADRVRQANAQLALTSSEDANQFALARSQQGLSGAEFADTQAQQRDEFLDSERLGAAEYGDTFAATGAEEGLQAALARAGQENAAAATASDAASSYASATRDWAASDRAAQDTRDQIAALKKQAALTAGGAAARPLTGPLSGGFTHAVGNAATGTVQW